MSGPTPYLYQSPSLPRCWWTPARGDERMLGLPPTHCRKPQRWDVLFFYFYTEDVLHCVLIYPIFDPLGWIIQPRVYCPGLSPKSCLRWVTGFHDKKLLDCHCLTVRAPLQLCLSLFRVFNVLYTGCKTLGKEACYHAVKQFNICLHAKTETDYGGKRHCVPSFPNCVNSYVLI